MQLEEQEKEKDKEKLSKEESEKKQAEEQQKRAKEEEYRKRQEDKTKKEVSQTNPDNQSATVYTTNTGGKYHSGGCQYLRKSKIEINLKNAKSQGLTPCSKCHPPR